MPITLHATVQHHIPWIGDPRRDGFGNPPDGFTSMTRAAQVRQALSFAIDRALIAEVLFSNAAWVNYVYGHDINNPNWQDKWNVEYNPELAGQMLDEVGYPKNEDGIRFEMPFFIRIGRGDEEIGTAVVGMWREMGDRYAGLEGAIPDLSPESDRTNGDGTVDPLRGCRGPASAVGLAGSQ